MPRTLAATLGELRRSGYCPRSVKDEMRANLIGKLKAGEELFPGIVGYEVSVVPQLVNAILARHNLILLGLRGQAKSRILRQLVEQIIYRFDSERQYHLVEFHLGDIPTIDIPKSRLNGSSV